MREDFFSYGALHHDHPYAAAQRTGVYSCDLALAHISLGLHEGYHFEEAQFGTQRKELLQLFADGIGRTRREQLEGSEQVFVVHGVIHGKIDAEVSQGFFQTAF